MQWGTCGPSSCIQQKEKEIKNIQDYENMYENMKKNTKGTVLYINGVTIFPVSGLLHMMKTDIALEEDCDGGCFIIQSDGCGEGRPAVALLPPLSLPQSSADGAT